MKRPAFILLATQSLVCLAVPTPFTRFARTPLAVRAAIEH